MADNGYQIWILIQNENYYTNAGYPVRGYRDLNEAKRALTDKCSETSGWTISDDGMSASRSIDLYYIEQLEVQ